MSVLFGAYGWFLWEWRAVQLWPSDNMNVFYVSCGKTTLSIYVKRRNFWLSVSPGSAGALVRWGGKVKYHFCFLRNISAKNYQNLLMYVEVVASQSSLVFFETHCMLSILKFKCQCNDGSIKFRSNWRLRLWAFCLAYLDKEADRRDECCRFESVSCEAGMGVSNITDSSASLVLYTTNETCKQVKTSIYKHNATNTMP